MKRFGAFGLLVLGMAITGIRLLLYGAVSFPAGILVFQILNGLAFPFVLLSLAILAPAERRLSGARLG